MIPGAPSVLAAILPTGVTVQVTLGAATNALSYEARINDGLGGSLDGPYKSFGTAVSSWENIQIGRTYQIGWHGVNGADIGPEMTGTFIINSSAPAAVNDGFFAVLLATLG